MSQGQQKHKCAVCEKFWESKSLCQITGNVAEPKFGKKHHSACRILQGWLKQIAQEQDEKAA